MNINHEYVTTSKRELETKLRNAINKKSKYKVDIEKVKEGLSTINNIVSLCQHNSLVVDIKTKD